MARRYCLVIAVLLAALIILAAVITQGDVLRSCLGAGVKGQWQVGQAALKRVAVGGGLLNGTAGAGRATSAGPSPASDAFNTSIVILSNLIPTHPNITMLNDTYESLFAMLDGLPPSTPTFISVDGLPAGTGADPKKHGEDLKRLQGYVDRLRRRFRDCCPHVVILNNYLHGHINHSIRRALDAVRTEFMYVIQHDFKFIRHVDHAALERTLRDHSDKIQCIRFDKNKDGSVRNVREDCKATYDFHGVTFTAGQWSDNNHFTRRSYYKRLLPEMGPRPRPPEFMMMARGNHKDEECSYVHQFLYNHHEAPFLEHLDGRQSTVYGR